MKLLCMIGSISLVKSKQRVVSGEVFEVDDSTADTLLKHGYAVAVPKDTHPAVLEQEPMPPDEPKKSRSKKVV